MDSRAITRPDRSTIFRCPAALGLLFRSGRYSFVVIERGTFQLGLMTMNSIWSENSGLRWSGTFLPITDRVWKVILP